MTEIAAEIDHIAVAAHTLAQGVEYVRACLGIELPYGGAHPRMGTHNHLVRLGPAVFLEIIAIDPAAAPPPRPRWFQLDDPAVQAELAAAPRLWTWVVRTPDIAGALLACRRPLGAIQPITRGALRWLITIPDDGTLVDGGAMPALIHWPGEHPAGRMADLGCTLERLEIEHADPDSLRGDLASIGADQLVAIRPGAPGTRPRLVAQIRTPGGIRRLI